MWECTNLLYDLWIYQSTDSCTVIRNDFFSYVRKTKSGLRTRLRTCTWTWTWTWELGWSQVKTMWCDLVFLSFCLLVIHRMQPPQKFLPCDKLLCVPLWLVEDLHFLLFNEEAPEYTSEQWRSSICTVCGFLHPRFTSRCQTLLQSTPATIHHSLFLESFADRFQLQEHVTIITKQWS